MVKNLSQLMKKFNTEDKCREFLIQQRWNGQPSCPYCGHNKAYRIEKGKRFKCANNKCYKKFTVTVGTVMEASNIPLTKWLPACYIIMSHKKGISSVQLGKDLGVTQKTAWFMLHRIRESLKENHPEMLQGTIEADETYLGRKFRSDYVGLSPEEIDYNLNASHASKGLVLGLHERESGKIFPKVFEDKKAEKIKPEIKKRVAPGSMLYTDEAYLYRSGLDEYSHEAVFHSKKEWVRPGNIHVNNVEAFWSVLKRGIYGIYHQVSYKHLQAYCNEFAFRHNSRKIKDGERFFKQMSNLEGRLSYKRLVYGKGKENKDEQIQA